MSTEGVMRFVTMVSNQAELQHHVDALNGDLPGLVRLASANDCQFSAQDWIDTVTALRDRDELSDEALDKVVGGTTSTTASLGDFSSRFACFPPIGTSINLGASRTLIG